jgi:hypothetical protein
MVEQALARNSKAIEGGSIDLRHGSVESLPFEDNSFTRALAINSTCTYGPMRWQGCKKCGGWEICQISFPKRQRIMGVFVSTEPVNSIGLIAPGVAP